MIKEILNGDFMDCKIVQEKCRSRGMKKAKIKMYKEMEGIKTVEVTAGSGEKIWLWFDPQQIWEKYHAREKY